MSDDIELPDGPLRFTSAAVADDLRAENQRLRELYTVSVRVAADNQVLAARVEELEARVARAVGALERRIGEAETWAQYGDNRSNAARRILRGENER